MAGEWPIVEIGSIANIYDGPHATPSMSEDGPIFLGIDSLENGRLNIAGARRVSEGVFRDWTRRVVPTGGDLVFSYETRLGQAALIPTGLRCCLGRRLALVRPKSSALNSRYFLYYFLSPVFQEHLRAHTKPGSTVDRIHLSDFPKFPVALPPRRYQDEIAELLGSLDEKIESNRRVAETLEALARALFKSWFVDFDAVHAKAEGRPTGLPDDLAVLFPDSFNEDGLPKGWDTQSVLNQAEWVNGAAYKDIHFSDASDALPVIKIAELKNGITATTKYTNTDLGDRYRIKTGELLFSWSGSPDTSIDTFIWAEGDAWLNQHIFAVRPNGSTTRAYLFAMLKFLKGELIEVARNKQTTGLGHVTRQDLARIQIYTGGAAVLAAFEATLDPLYEKLQATAEESRTLAALRDTLLPKLISGELRISKAEKMVSAA